MAAVDGIERVRFTSPYPLDFADDVVAAIAETPKICKHVHLPLQSAIGRGARAHAARLRLRDVPRAATTSCARCPGIAITTDLLIGFCDETEDEFRATLRAQEELRFDGAFTFAYSEREGTYAARKMPDTVPAEVKQRRLAEVIALQQRITRRDHGGAGRQARARAGRAARRSDRPTS